jgi:glucan phosphoethanolaminetransferase (alkaline phosphatase superfamily)
MNYNHLKSRTFWTSILLFLFNGFAAISGSVPSEYSVPINFVLGALVTHVFIKSVIVFSRLPRTVDLMD